MAKADGRGIDSSQTPLVSPLTLKGLLVSSANSASRVSSKALLLKRACPGTAEVTKPSGTHLQRHLISGGSLKIEVCTYQIVLLSSGFAGPPSRKRSWRTLMPVEVSVTVSTGKPIFVKNYSGSYLKGAAPYLRNPVIHYPGNVKSFGASLINYRNGGNPNTMHTSRFADTFPQVAGDRVRI